jgi:hypothetical protein
VESSTEMNLKIFVRSARKEFRRLLHIHLNRMELQKG